MVQNKEIIKKIKHDIGNELPWLMLRNFEFRSRKNIIFIKAVHIYKRDLIKVEKIAKKHLTNEKRLAIHGLTMENSLKW